MKTLTSVLAQIERLTKEAEELKARERAGVIDRIRDAIAAYDITTAELTGPRKKAAGVKQPVKKASTPTSYPIKYDDKRGNTWIGYGHRPEWVKELYDMGKDIEVYRVKEKTK